MKTTYAIGEISRIYGISRDALRFYEKEGLLSPRRMGNGYRRYAIFDIWKLNLIKKMRLLGFSLKDIRRFIEHRSFEQQRLLFLREKAYIDQEIRSLSLRKKSLEDRLKALRDIAAFKGYDRVIYKDIAERKIIYLDGSLSSDSQVDMSFGRLLGDSDFDLEYTSLDFGTLLPVAHIRTKRLGEYRGAFLIVKDGSAYQGVLPGGRYATIRFRGSYDKAETAYGLLFDALRKGRYAMPEHAIEQYLIDVHQTSDENEYVTEIQVKIDA